ncbi:hypothetical protein ACVT18_14615 [Klebsiella pneumoniae]
MRGVACRISSPLTTLTAAGVSSSETVVGAAVTTMVCSSAAWAAAMSGKSRAGRAT